MAGPSEGKRVALLKRAFLPPIQAIFGNDFRFMGKTAPAARGLPS